MREECPPLSLSGENIWCCVLFPPKEDVLYYLVVSFLIVFTPVTSKLSWRSFAPLYLTYSKNICNKKVPLLNFH